MNEEKTVRLDRMRYAKNTLSANLCYLAILFDVFFFLSIYNSDVGSYYYNIVIGASILYNLIFMLMAFLASEGIKNYRIPFAYLLGALGAIQLLRIFLLPVRAHGATVKLQDQTVQVMGDGQFFRVVLYLCLSAACLLAAALVGYRRSKALRDYEASLDTKAA